jgi:hypothetical protein
MMQTSFSDTYTSQRRSLFIGDKATLSSERMLRKDYDRKGSVAKNKTLVVIIKGLGAKAN